MKIEDGVPSVNPKLDAMVEMLKTLHNLDERNKVLEKEKAELKSDYEVLSCSVGDFGELQEKLEEEQRKNNGLSDNLTKAKRYIKELLKAVESSYSVLSWQRPPIKAEAEQFLKEVDK